MNKEFLIPEPSLDLIQRAEQVKSSSTKLGQTTNEERQRALMAMADALQVHSKEIIQANHEDSNTHLPHLLELWITANWRKSRKGWRTR